MRVRVRVRVWVWVWVWVRMWVRVGLRHLLPLEGGEAGEELVEYHPEGPPVTGGFEAPCATLDRLGRLGRGEG